MAKNNRNDIKYNETIFPQTLEEVLHNSMIPYAEHVILERALPRVEDGLKPVQRRILYAMHELGLTPDKPHKKSARIVGETLGKYHPHGESSVYDAMVRMSQDYNMRGTLVDGHGNFGSIDGDSAAAMRYTEARLTPLALELLKDLDKDTVKWSLNFDDSLTEPDMLPGRFPNLLVNGASGIAVGLATNIPTHNLAEVIDATIAQIDNPRITVDELLTHVKGPDFPTGGIIINAEELPNIYKTGKGRIIVRAKTSVENMNNGKKAIIIHEVPYQVGKATLLEKILKISEEKKGILAGISDIRDESDRMGMRAVIELKRDVDPEKVLQVLYKYSDLQTSFGANMVAIADGKPQQLGLKEMLKYYIDHQKSVERKRVRFDLDQAKSRAHILEGLVIAVKNIDKVIKIIRSSKHTTEAKERLRDTFKLSDKQAQAILDMRLARLTALEIENLEKELKQLLELIAELEAILASEKKLLAVIKENLLVIRRKYKDARRTQIVANGKETTINHQEALKVVEDVVIAVDALGNVKRINEKSFGRSNYEELPENADDICTNIVKIKTDEKLVAFTKEGNYYCIPCEDIPESKWKDRSNPLSLYGGPSADETVIAVMPANEMKGVLNFYTANGMVKRTEAAEYSTARKGKIQAISLKDGDSVIKVEIDSEKNDKIAYISEKGNALIFEKEEVTPTGRTTQGVKAMALDDDDKVMFASGVSDEGELVIMTDRGYGKRTLMVDYDCMQRNRKGQKVIDFKKNGTNGERIAGAFYVTDPVDMVVVQKRGGLYEMNTDGLLIETRTSPGRSYVIAVLDDVVEKLIKKPVYKK